MTSRLLIANSFDSAELALDPYSSLLLREEKGEKRKGKEGKKEGKEGT